MSQQQQQFKHYSVPYTHMLCYTARILHDAVSTFQSSHQGYG